MIEMNLILLVTLVSLVPLVVRSLPTCWCYLESTWDLLDSCVFRRDESASFTVLPSESLSHLFSRIIVNRHTHRVMVRGRERDELLMRNCMSDYR